MIPAVLYNRVCPGYTSVNGDDAHMGALAAKAFSDQGCHRAMVLTSPPVFEGMEVRVQGFVLEGAAHGLETIGAPFIATTALRAGIRPRAAVCGKKTECGVPDAVFCGSSMIAHGAMRAMWESGIPRGAPAQGNCHRKRQ